MMRTATAAIFLALSFAAPAHAQSCNPVIDGTYCEMYPPRSSSPAPSSRGGVSLDPIRPSLADDLSPNRDFAPATLGAITFRGGGSQCVGLLRRGKCN